MSFLTRTYPFKQSKHLLRDSIAYGVIIWAILYLMQPFGFSTYQGNKCLAAALFGAVTFSCYAIHGLIVKKVLLHAVKSWRIWHYACMVLSLVFIIAVCNLFVFFYLFHYPVTFELILLCLYWTLIIGVIMTTLSIVIQYNRTLKDRMEELLCNTTEEQKDITITIHDTNVRGNDLTIPINNLLYIEAQKNNISVCYVKDDKPTSMEIHNTLSNAVADLKEYENIFQCHRSFVVNINNITSAQGNSNGYQLTLGNCTNSIPVSRSYVPQLKAFIA